MGNVDLIKNLCEFFSSTGGQQAPWTLRAGSKGRLSQFSVCDRVVNGCFGERRDRGLILRYQFVAEFFSFPSEKSPEAA